jgi:hypothetical protein
VEGDVRDAVHVLRLGDVDALLVSLLKRFFCRFLTIAEDRVVPSPVWEAIEHQWP